jgi:hypothetical protein
MTNTSLTVPERRSIDRQIPLHQAKIHIAFRCFLDLNGSPFDGAVALTEHLLVIFKDSACGGILKKSIYCGIFHSVKAIHLLDITSFATNSLSDCVIATIDSNVRIQAGQVIEFARYLIRNYYIITIMFRPIICIYTCSAQSS